MKRILLITSSPRGEESHSTKVSRELVSRLQNQYPGSELIERNLLHTSLPLLDEAYTGAMFTPEEVRTTDQRERLSLSDEMISELLEADVVVVASGMINFGIPASLKAWFDLVVRAGVTFKYGEAGPIGLLQGKKAYVVTAAGGVYSSGPMQVFDFQTPYIKSVLSFIGVEVVDTITVEGTALGPESQQAALASATQKVLALTAA